MNKISDGEYRLMELVWAQEPVNSTELIRAAAKELGWKKPTTYTVIRKLCEKGILQNEQATVTSLVTRDDIVRQASDELLSKNFHNSILSFMACFLDGRKLSAEEADELKRMIDTAKEDN
jgi:predicted transcriptional regulator